MGSRRAANCSRGVQSICSTLFSLQPKAQRKKLGKKEMPLLRALPEPATFFGKKVDQKTKLGAARCAIERQKMKPFKLLMLGDVVGQNALSYLEGRLRRLRDQMGIAFTVVNGENVAAGNGIDPESARRLLHAGADVITTGNHVFRRKEIKSYLDDEPRLLRPANYPPACYGSGTCITEADGLRILVINLLGTVFMDPLASPFEVADKILTENAGKYELAVVDFHAEATAEKIALGHYLAGRAVAFAGTHTHVQTADLTVLPEGCGYITDLGMCGPEGTVLGVKKELIIEHFTTKMPVRHEIGDGKILCHGAVFTVDRGSRRCIAAEPVVF